MLRTPNMEGPCANFSLYVSLAHEYGFCGSNLGYVSSQHQVVTVLLLFELQK